MICIAEVETKDTLQRRYRTPTSETIRTATSALHGLWCKGITTMRYILWYMERTSTNTTL